MLLISSVILPFAFVVRVRRFWRESPPDLHHHRSWVHVDRVFGLELEVRSFKFKLMAAHQGRYNDKQLEVGDVTADWMEKCWLSSLLLPVWD